MQNYLLLFVILILVFYLSDYLADCKNKVFMNFDIHHDNKQTPLYFNIDLKEICKTLEPESKEYLQKCEPELQKNYEPEKIKESPLDKAYRISNTDRYMTDNVLNLSNSDDKLTLKMHQMGQKPFESILARSMWSKSSLLPYLEEELNENEESVWWESDMNDQLENDTNQIDINSVFD